MWYDDDFYDEPSEFEIQMGEFKESIMRSVKQEILDKIDSLEKENAKLRVYRDERNEYENEVRKKIREYNQAIEKARIEAESKSLRKLLGDQMVIAYRPKLVTKNFKKCNRCDNDRRIYYKTPLGREQYETCVCKTFTINSYEPTEVKLLSFLAWADKSVKNTTVTCYYENFSDDSLDRYSYADQVFQLGMKFDDLNRYRAVFLNYDTCKNYCGWLTAKEKESAKEIMNKWNLEIEE